MENPTKKRVLVFGCSKAGKTSMLNTITGEKFKVSDAAVGTTFETQPFPNFEYNGKIYQFVDTAGLDESSGGNVPSQEALSNLYEVANDKEGFNLYIMVMLKGGISQAIKKNYELFINHMKAKKIPVLCVVTRCESDDPLNKWVNNNRRDLEKKYEMEFDDMIGSCFAQERDGPLAEIYEKLRAKSKEDVMKIIDNMCAEEPYSISRKNLPDIFAKLLAVYFKFMNTLPSAEWVDENLIRLGFNEEERQSIKESLQNIATFAVIMGMKRMIIRQPL